MDSPSCGTSASRKHHHQIQSWLTFGTPLSTSTKQGLRATSLFPNREADRFWALPNKRLAIAAGGRLAFGLIDVKELEDRALAVVRSIEDEFMAEAESWWVEMNSGR